MTTGKIIALTRQTFVGKVTSLLFNMMSRLVITFLPRASVLILWLQSWSAVILEPPKIKYVAVSTVFPSICHEVTRPDAMIFALWMLSFKPAFSLSSSPSPRGSLVPLHRLPFRYPIKANDRMFPLSQKVLLGSDGVGPSFAMNTEAGVITYQLSFLTA